MSLKNRETETIQHNDAETYDEIPDFCYVQLQGWMIKLAHTYDLSLNELMIYAVIHSFSQDGVSVFRGSRNYLRLWAFCGRTCVFEKIRKLLDLHLIGKDFVTYRGKEFPVYFSFASREKKAVQNLNSKGEKQAMQSGIRTESVQNLNADSSEFGPNNNLNKNLKKAASAFLISKITENLGCNPFSDAFISKMSETFTAKGFDEKRVGEYLAAVTEKVIAKKPESIPAFFKKIVLEEDVLADFLIRHSAQKTAKGLICPVCGKENTPGSYHCTHCDFDFSYSHDKKEVEKARKIFILPPQERQEREEEIRKVYELYPISEYWNQQAMLKRNRCLDDIDKKYKVI
ncbi:MAG: hypothetical protein MJ185_02845 [Treponema sp.]|nr:hypothetical protein [Treponema sp.]